MLLTQKEEVLGTTTTSGNSFFVSSDASIFGSGSIDDPWTLETALNHPSAVQPGDTIYLLPGTYGDGGSQKYISRVAGGESKYITIRPYELGTARINGGIEIYGQWVIFRDLEVFNSYEVRESIYEGSHPADIIQPGGFNIFAPNSKFIYNVVHDTRQGISAWIQAPNTEIYGNILYNNGWTAPDREHGHGIYFQNYEGVKNIEANILAPSIDETGIHGYGEAETSKINNVTIEGNVSFSRLWRSKTNTLSKNLIIKNNYAWNTFAVVGNVSDEEQGLIFQNNHFYGNENRTASIDFGGNEKQTVINNFICNPNAYILFHSFSRGMEDLTLDYNSYCNASDRTNIFLVTNQDTNTAYTYEGWKSYTGFDSHSTLSKSLPNENEIFIVKANKYEPKRGNVVVYNWRSLDTVYADVSDLGLTVGDKYEIRNSQNYFGDAPLTGTYDGSQIPIPMSSTRWTRLKPIGYDSYVLGVTLPTFNTFILRVTNGTSDTPEDIYCGDLLCNGSETCTTCPLDCGSCPIIDPEDPPEEPITPPEPIIEVPINPQGNLINNFSFEDNYNSWLSFANGDTDFEISSYAYEGNKSAFINVQEVSSNMQLYQTGFQLKSNTRYKIQFYARSENGSNLMALIHKHTYPYDNYGLTATYDLTSEWQKFVTEFDTSNISNETNDTRLRLWFTEDSLANERYYIDSVALVEISELIPTEYCGDKICNNNETCTSCSQDCGECPPPTEFCGDKICNNNETCTSCSQDCGECPPSSPENVVLNGDFESGDRPWIMYTSGEANFHVTGGSYDGTNRAKISVDKLGTQIQFYQKDLKLEEGKKYKLSFYAKSSGGNDVSMFIHKHVYPYTDYGLANKVAKLSNSWNKYEMEFTASGFDNDTNDARLRFWLTPYAKAGDTYYFDNVKIEEY